MVVVFQLFCIFSLDKSFKTYLGTMLPPWWQKLAADFPSLLLSLNVIITIIITIAIHSWKVKAVCLSMPDNTVVVSLSLIRVEHLLLLEMLDLD